MSDVPGGPNEGSALIRRPVRSGRKPFALAAGAFLGGAKSRLLPASIPFRYFGAAVAYHVLAWLALLLGADAVPNFAGGLGWPLAALHLITLGVLVMTAIGASLQLLPVATLQPLCWPRAPAVIWWLYTPGVAATALGMGMPAPAWLVSGALLVALALVGYAVLLARNLIGARGMPVVAAHGWVALSCLVIVVASALSLACAYAGVPGLARGTALALHSLSPVTASWGCSRWGFPTSWCRCSRFRRRPMREGRRRRACWRSWRWPWRELPHSASHRACFASSRLGWGPLPLDCTSS